MSYCTNLKQKMNKTLYCKKHNKLINIKDCSNCQFKDYKHYKKLQTKNEYHYKPKKRKM